VTGTGAVRDGRPGTASRTMGAALAAGALLVPAGAVPAGAVPAGAVPAGAVGEGDQDGAVALSVDGTTWTSDLDTPLFDASVWVPGETRRSVLLVRNDGPGVAQGEVAVALGDGTADGTGGEAAAALADALRVRVRPAGDPWSVAARPASVTLAESEVLPVALEVTLAASAGDETQGASVPLDVVVTLTGDGVGDGADDEGGSPDGPGQGAPGQGAPGHGAPGDGDLPRTGLPTVPLLAAVGAVLLGALLRWTSGARRGRRG